MLSHRMAVRTTRDDNPIDCNVQKLKNCQWHWIVHCRVKWNYMTGWQGVQRTSVHRDREVTMWTCLHIRQSGKEWVEQESACGCHLDKGCSTRTYYARRMRGWLMTWMWLSKTKSKRCFPWHDSVTCKVNVWECTQAYDLWVEREGGVGDDGEKRVRGRVRMDCLWCKNTDGEMWMSQKGFGIKLRGTEREGCGRETAGQDNTGTEERLGGLRCGEEAWCERTMWHMLGAVLEPPFKLPPPPPPPFFQLVQSTEHICCMRPQQAAVLTATELMRPMWWACNRWQWTPVTTPHEAHGAFISDWEASHT